MKINDDVSLVMIPDERYSDVLLDITRQASQAGKKVLYISMKRGCNALAKTFREKNIDASNIFILDGCSEEHAACDGGRIGCKFIDTPDLSNLSLAMFEIFMAFDPEYISFDSLSELMHEDAEDVLRFSNTLIGTMRKSKRKGIFAAKVRSLDPQFIKDLSLFVDKVTHL